MVTSSCLLGLLGLSAAGSTCFPLPVVAAPGPGLGYITDSASGRYLDQTPGLRLRPAQNQAAGGNVYQLLDNARTQAMAELQSELSRHLSGQYGPAVAPLVGTFGGLGDGSYLPLSQQPLLVLPTRRVPGRAYELLSLSLYASAAVTGVPVLLDGKQIATVNTNSTPVPLAGIRVPLDGQAHTLTATLPEGVRARTGTLTCGCSDQHPNVRLALAGLRGDAEGLRYNRSASSGGFVLNLQTTCTEPSTLCYALGQDEDLRDSAAAALQYRAAALFLESLEGASYSRYTMLDVKELEGQYQRYQAKADEFVGWLTGSGGLTRVPNPCYGCAPSAVQMKLVRG